MKTFLLHLEQRGKDEFGTHFHFCQADLPLIHKLLAYFLNDEKAAQSWNIDLQKGILLRGPVGCGKSSLMRLMRSISPADRKYTIKDSRDLSFEFIKDGYAVLQQYSSSSKRPNCTANYCFDDLGTETNLKYYGNECNIMAEIILSRYDLFVSKQIQTHLITNLSASELEHAYGNRVRSRLRQMLNLIAFDKSTPDKR